ncbi:MAG: NAD(P)H-dependent oxidoreductase [Spirochaetales bacterium]|nr:NAD(P)H-dependent oxidoreductase [Spirochaetales bacterium]
MKVLVLNGSPKGKFSVSLQTVLFLEKRFGGDSFEIINVGQQIKKFERDFAGIAEAVETADLILFAYPVYTFLVPYQLHRFIELIKEHGINLNGKKAAQILTSKHFYDITAMNFIEENCADLGLNYIGALSADMDDLLEPKGQKEALDFWNYVHFCADNSFFRKKPHFTSTQSPAYSASLPIAEKSPGFDTVIVTNAQQDPALEAMIEDFRRTFAHPTRVVNIAEYPFSGGCLGCFSCAADGTCIYKDGFDSFLREKIQKADSIIYAFTVKDHSMGATFKRYDDRQFCNGHRTVTVGMPIGYIVNGDLTNETNLRMLIDSRSEVGNNFLCGVSTDKQSIAQLARTTEYALMHRPLLPQNFYGIGGKKIFRDLIYLMRGLTKADHKFYKKQGIYDFPHKRKLYTFKIQLLGAMMAIPQVKTKLRGQMNEAIIKPYQKVIDGK